ncbi:MAG: hypothetical protein ACRDFZ_01505 [Candidatus Limnocylindria bacterium]
MVPWAIWTVMVGAINLTLFVAVRGRWGGQAVILALASLAGTAAGNALAGLVEFDLLKLGEFHLAGAIIGAQLALVTTAALATLFSSPDGSGRRRDGAGPGR